ncbi:hypothetical protein M5D96_001361 [Drosophila gunungcola]|uniref:Uncharacterized protein n=1 Tax=Drosophila gunungcola TaxID=103775 RepID=A0A9Q0BUI6_9MUSC|nr:hypothetical protein M5D96_001361 [Drosophila gunungcola]
MANERSGGQCPGRPRVYRCTSFMLTLATTRPMLPKVPQIWGKVRTLQGPTPSPDK